MHPTKKITPFLATVAAAVLLSGHPSTVYAGGFCSKVADVLEDQFKPEKVIPVARTAIAALNQVLEVNEFLKQEGGSFIPNADKLKGLSQDATAWTNRVEKWLKFAHEMESAFQNARLKLNYPTVLSISLFTGVKIKSMASKEIDFATGAASILDLWEKRRNEIFITTSPSDISIAVVAVATDESKDDSH
jgi:hypothetical protein